MGNIHGVSNIDDDQSISSPESIHMQGETLAFVRLAVIEYGVGFLDCSLDFFWWYFVWIMHSQLDVGGQLTIVYCLKEGAFMYSNTYKAKKEQHTVTLVFSNILTSVPLARVYISGVSIRMVRFLAELGPSFWICNEGESENDNNQW